MVSPTVAVRHLRMPLTAVTGFSLLLFMITIWFLLGTSRKRRRINYVMLGASCALMALNTAVSPLSIVYSVISQHRRVGDGGKYCAYLSGSRHLGSTSSGRTRAILLRPSRCDVCCKDRSVGRTDSHLRRSSGETHAQSHVRYHLTTSLDIQGVHRLAKLRGRRGTDLAMVRTCR